MTNDITSLDALDNLVTGIAFIPKAVKGTKTQGRNLPTAAQAGNLEPRLEPQSILFIYLLYHKPKTPEQHTFLFVGKQHTKANYSKKKRK